MATHDYVIANQGFPAFRSDLNDALAAIVSNNSSATEPTTMFAHMIWVDTAANPSIIKIRNADNDAWITIGSLNQTADTFTLTSAVSATTLNTSGAVVFNDAGADVDFRVEGDTDANLLFVDASTDRVGIGTGSPAYKLDVGGNVNRFAGNGVDGLFLSTVSATDISYYGANYFNNDGTEGVNASGRASWRITTSTPSASPYFSIDYRAPSAAAGTFTPRMTLDSSGRLLVGSTSSVGSGGIEVKNGAGALTGCYDAWNTATSGNNLFMGFATEASYTSRGSIDYNRGAGLVRYNTTSDATLKNIIGDSDGQKSVEILNSTRIREFAWKDDEAQKPQIGVIAQELYETFNGAVSVGGDYEVTVPAVTEQRLVSKAVLDEDGNEIEAAVYETIEVEPERTETKYRPWGVDKTAFTFHLVAGWQAHEKIIKQQAEMIAALEARIAALENA